MSSLFEKEILSVSDWEKNSLYLVDSTSLLKHRIQFLRNFFDYIVTHGFRESTVSSLIGKVRLGFNYLDERIYYDFLKDINQTIRVYNTISKELKHKVSSNSIKPTTAWRIQNSVGFLITIRFGKSVADYIVKNIVKIRSKSSPTQPRQIDELKTAYELYRDLATGLTKLLIEEEPLPFLLRLPGYETYLFPYASHRVTPYCHRPTMVYNHKKGRIATEEEYFAKNPGRYKGSLRADLKRTTKILQHSNTNPRSKCRRAFAATAMQAYHILFMMLTGSYLSEVAQIEDIDSFEMNESLTHKSFRAVKFRAGGRVVQYDLAAGAVELFENYLQLREWVLDGKNYHRLFFNLMVKSWQPCTLEETTLRSFQRKK